jgi:copper chaperone CopZ
VCAHAVRVAIQKLPGVESVDVSLERASTDIRLRAGNTITLQQLRGIVKNNGFTTKAAIVTVDGVLVEHGGQPALRVTGTDSVLSVAVDPKQPAAFKDVQARLRGGIAAGQVTLVGVIQPRADPMDRIEVQEVVNRRR